VIEYYAEATKHDNTWYKAWHLFAYLNYEAVLFYKQQRLTATEVTPAATSSNDSIASPPDESRAEVSLCVIKLKHSGSVFVKCNHVLFM